MGGLSTFRGNLSLKTDKRAEMRLLRKTYFLDTPCYTCTQTPTPFLSTKYDYILNSERF